MALDWYGLTRVQPRGSRDGAGGGRAFLPRHAAPRVTYLFSSLSELLEVAVRRILLAAIASVAVACGGPSSPPPPVTAIAPSSPTSTADVLRSWNEGGAKGAIVDFVGRVTREGGPDFVPVPERIATVDNDGTLWAEKPVPFQLFFMLDRVKAMAPQHPEWGTKEPFASALKGNLAGLAASGERGILQLM